MKFPRQKRQIKRINSFKKPKTIKAFKISVCRKNVTKVAWKWCTYIINNALSDSLKSYLISMKKANHCCVVVFNGFMSLRSWHSFIINADPLITIFEIEILKTWKKLQKLTNCANFKVIHIFVKNLKYFNDYVNVYLINMQIKKG